MIRAGKVQEVVKDSGQWVFVDLGFSKREKSCGLLIGDKKPIEVTFSDLVKTLTKITSMDDGALNLLLEAPLSVAFQADGNPTGRSIERRGAKTRYWYVGLGCSVLVSATYLLRAISQSRPTREIRLFEGLASFKPKGVVSSHSKDVLALRSVVWRKNSKIGYIVSPDELKMSLGDKIESAFLVSGMDYGIPPVVALGG